MRMEIVDKSGQLIWKGKIPVSGQEFSLVFPDPLLVDLGGVLLRSEREQRKGDTTKQSSNKGS